MNSDHLEQFTTKDKRTIEIAIFVAVVCVLVGWFYFDDAFPEAHITFEVDKNASKTIATNFLESQGLSTTQYMHASMFDYDNQAKIYLERTQGLEKTNELISGDIKVWHWNHRWYQSRQKEEFRVHVSPLGALTFFEHILPEDMEGANLTRTEAEVVARNFLIEELNRPGDRIRFIEHASTKLPNRTDHSFIWERTDLQFDGSSYRYEVTIKGESLGSYREFLKIPETWSRDYQQLRSANNTAGTIASFLLLLTAAAMFIILIQKARLSDIRWKTAIIFGIIAFVLTLGTQLNSLPLTFYNYETTDSYGNFITQEILLSLLQAFMAGGGIFFLTAAAEPLYRERYKNKLSLTKAFTLDGIKTKNFFIAVIIGLVLTCFFVAYQTVFYLVSSEFGAWSPADVPYSDLINTAVPWVFVLLMGFFPAVSEEFISRMFSIPFLEKYIKVRWLAVIIPAFIWGFGHAAYPNQPFYIRGLEVGVAGIIIGYVMLRFGIVATLIWHYTVDALYTAFLLFRSGDAYYIMTGAISAGIMLIPLVIAGYFYLRNGGFLPADELTNSSEGVAVQEKGEKDKELPVQIHYQWLSNKRIILGMVVAVMVLFAAFLPGERPTNFVNVKFNNSEIQQKADVWLETKTDSSEIYKSAVTMHSTEQSQNFKYMMEHSSVDTAASILESLLYPSVWRVRYFRPLKREEFRIHYHPDNGNILAFQHILPESAPGDSLAEQGALQIAIQWLNENGVDTSNYAIRTIEQDAQPNRLDWDITLEGKDSFWATIDDGKPLINVRILGSEVGLFSKDYKLPEEWTRSRTARTLGSTVHNIGRIALLILFGILGIVLLIMKMRQTDFFRWKPPIIIGGVVAVLVILMGLNRMNGILADYPTTIPWNQFTLLISISLLVGGIGIGGVILLGAALTRAYYPGSLLAWKAPERYIFARDALVATGIAIVGFIGIEHLQTWLQLQFPDLAIFSFSGLPQMLDTKIPAFSAIGSAFTRGILFAIGMALFAILWKDYLKHPVLQSITVILILLVLVPPNTLTTQEWILQVGVTALPILWVGFVWLFFIRDNYLSYLFIPVGLLGLNYGVKLYSQNGQMYIIHGIIVFAIFAVLLFWTLADAFRHRDREEFLSVK